MHMQDKRMLETNARDGQSSASYVNDFLDW